MRETHYFRVMRHQFTTPPELGSDDRELLDLHSVLNIFNVLMGQLQVLGLQLRDDDRFFSDAEDVARNYLGALRDPARQLPSLENLESFIDLFLDRVKQRLAMVPDCRADPRVRHAQENLASCLQVLRQRAAEYRERLGTGEEWVDFPLEKLRNNFLQVFQAIEKNSGGRYHIVYNLARQETADYFVDMKLESINGRIIRMPAVFQDTIRDLVANARKYTEPGGRILVGLYDDGAQLRLVVEDNGCGIPEAELPQVTEFGFRASNALDKPTMGGGFGLTKAHHVVHRFGGTLVVDSEVGRGTRIEIEVPRPT